MVRVMFIGGHKHRALMEVPRWPKPYFEAPIPEPPWKRNEMIQPYQAGRPARAYMIRTERYRLERLTLGPYRMAYVYILSGWKPSTEQILSEPGIGDELLEIAY